MSQINAVVARDGHGSLDRITTGVFHSKGCDTQACLNLDISIFYW